MMPLSPPDTDLDWQAVEGCLDEIPDMAESLWRKLGIAMPEGAAEEIKLNEMDTLLSETAAALGMPPADVYRNRHRIRWCCFADIGEPLTQWASLDGGAPQQINP